MPVWSVDHCHLAEEKEKQSNLRMSQTKNMAFRPMAFSDEEKTVSEETNREREGLELSKVPKGTEKGGKDWKNN